MSTESDAASTTGSSVVLREAFRQNAWLGIPMGIVLAVLWFHDAGWIVGVIWLAFPLWSWAGRNRLNYTELTPTELIVRRGFRRTRRAAWSDVAWIGPYRSGAATRVLVQDRTGVYRRLPVPFTAWWSPDRDFDARVRVIDDWYLAHKT